MHNFKAREPERVMYTGAFTLNPINNTIIMFDSFTTFKRRLIGDVPIILVGWLIVAGMFYVFWLWTKLYEGDQIMGIVISSINGAAITVLSTLYKVHILTY
jgi:anoctamin-10